MRLINETGNLKKYCFSNPAFQMLYQRILVTIKRVTTVLQPDSSEITTPESGFIPLINKEVTDSQFIDPATKVITDTQTEGTYPAYSYFLATKIKDIVPNWESLTKEQVGELLLYNLVAQQVDDVVFANGWYLTNGE